MNGYELASKTCLEKDLAILQSLTNPEDRNVVLDEVRHHVQHIYIDQGPERGQALDWIANWVLTMVMLWTLWAIARDPSPAMTTWTAVLSLNAIRQVHIGVSAIRALTKHGESREADYIKTLNERLSESGD